MLQGGLGWGGTRERWLRASSACCKVVSNGVALEREAVLSILAERCRIFEVESRADPE